MTKESIKILDKQYNHKSMVVTKNQYRFLKDDSTIVYQKGACGDNGTISFIIETQGLRANGNKEIMNFGEVKIILTPDNEIQFGPLKQQLEDFQSYMVICKWNHKNFTTELNVYKYVYPDGVPVYKLRPEMYEFDFDNPICEMTGPYNGDYNMGDVQREIWIKAYPCFITNIKYFNTALSHEEGIKESLKYTTNCTTCVFNDVARKLDDGFGYAVR